MKQYERYKESGVEWLERVPEHWEIIKSKYVWKEYIELSKNGVGDLLSVSQYKGITVNNQEQKTENLIGYKSVSENSLVINIMLAWMGGLGISKLNGLVSPAYAVYKATCPIIPQFYHYLYRTDRYLSEFARKSTGIVPSRWRMYEEDFGQIISILPPIEEQNVIASYLDQKCAQIDKAISQKERVIDLLNERRQIIIQRAVTRGLDPDVPMKDSGVDWIGEIPEHWEVKKIKHFGNIKSGDPITNSSIKDTGRYEVFGGNGLMGYTDKFNIEEERIIIGRVGALCGNIRMSDTRRFVTDNALIYCCNNRDIIKYLVILLRAANLNRLNTSNAQPLITGTKVLNVKLPIPPYDEQQQIATYLDNINAKIDKAIALKRQEIEKLKEYKTVLIDAAVTGKIKIA